MQQNPTPVLLLTHDDFLWQHWSALDGPPWRLTRSQSVANLQHWQQQSHSLVIIDTALLPDWKPGLWQPIFRDLRVIIASARPTDEEGVRAVAAGAMAYCHAYTPASTLAQILHAVVAGSVWMGASIVNRLVQQVDTLAPAPDTWRHPALSHRENEIALLVARGKSNSLVAMSCNISERTVKAHLTSIFEKLGVEDRLQLALLVHGIADKA